MKSTAVIITGQTRTMGHCWQTQREAVFRKLENPYFFLSLEQATADAAALNDFRRWVVEKYGEEHWHIELIDQPAMPEEDRERFEAASYHAPYYRSVPVEGIWKQFWALSRGWEFMLNASFPTLGGSVFSHFVRIRPDLHVHNWTKPKTEGKTVLFDLAVRNVPYPSTVFTPWWGSYGGLPDRFAYIAGADAAAQYFNVFYKINELLAEGCAYHPETMLGRALESAGVRVSQTLDAEFTTIRAKGDKRPHDVPSYQGRDVFNYVNARLAEEGRA